MPRYFATRPRALPPLPHLDASSLTSSCRQAARDWLAALDKIDGARQLIADTFAADRPGLDPADLLTDEEYMRRIAETPDADLVDAPAAPSKAKPAPKASRESASEPSPEPAYELAPGRGFLAGKVRAGAGRAAMAVQVLRSPAFSSPELGALLPLVADRKNARIIVEAPVPLTADHLDVLLFAISKVVNKPDPVLGTEVRFSIYEFVAALGWSDSQAGYARAIQSINELRRTNAILVEDVTAPKDKVDTIEFMLLGEFRRPGRGQADKKWSVNLPASLFELVEKSRCSLVDLNARAALRAPFARWLHGFFCTQTQGKRRAFGAVELCRAGGLQNARTANLLQHLRETLKCLESGQVERAGKTHHFAPVVAPGWSLTQDPSGEWVLEAEKA